MLAKKFSVGFALMAATACAQIPADAPINGSTPLPTRGATSVSYDTTTVPTRAEPLIVAAPASIPAPSYVEAPQYIPVSPPPTAVPSIAQQQAIISVPAERSYQVAAPVRPVSTPPVSVAPAPTVIAAPAAEIQEMTVLERVATFGEVERAPLPRSTGRQFRAIEVAALTPSRSDPFDDSANKPQPKPYGAQITTAEPFSISTGTSGTPYYQTSTPPAIEYHIPHIPQEEPLWCWAAAAQQAIGWVNNGRAPAQCAIVALAHGLDVEECCADREGICARTGEIPAIEKLVERFGGKGQELATVPRDPKQIYDILRGGDTLLIRIRPAPHDEAVGIRHMIVVRGIEWLRLPNNQLQATLLYNDPLGAGERAVNFDEIEGFFEQALVISRT